MLVFFVRVYVDIRGFIPGLENSPTMSKKKKQDATKTSPVYGFVASDAKSKAESTLNSDVAREEGKELWLIRVPYNADLTALTGAVIREKKTVNIKTKGGENKDCAVQITGIGKRSPPDKIGLIPSNSSPLLSQVNFAGNLSLTYCIPSPESTPLTSLPTPQPPSVPDGLKPRWKPFGWRSPSDVPGAATKVVRKRKRKTEDAKANTLPKKAKS